MQSISTIGLDIAKSVFPVHGGCSRGDRARQPSAAKLKATRMRAPPMEPLVSRRSPP